MNAPIRGIPLRPDREAYEREQRRSLIRAVTAIALAKGDPGDILRSAWPADAMADMFFKAATSPTSTSSFPSYSTAKTLPALAPRSVAVQLFAAAMNVDLSGVTQIGIPHATARPQPGFIGEGLAAPVAMYTLAQTVCGPAKKILIQSAVTAELDSATPETASTIIGRLLAEDVAKTLDAKLLDNVAADASRPEGLLYGVTPLTGSTAGTVTEKAAADVTALAAAIAAAGIDPAGMMVVANWAQATKLALLSGANFGHTIIGTGALAAGTVVGVAPAGIASGYSGSPEIEVSRQAAVHFEDTSPTNIGTAGSPNVVAAPTKSAWQHDLLIIKVRARCAWAKLPGAVQFLTGVGW